MTPDQLHILLIGGGTILLMGVFALLDRWVKKVRAKPSLDLRIAQGTNAALVHFLEEELGYSVLIDVEGSGVSITIQHPEQHIVSITPTSRTPQ